MLRQLRRSGTWRMIAVLMLVLAMALPMMPTAAFAAPHDGRMKSDSHVTVRPGDTLGEIARYFGVTVDAIMRANHLSSSRIYVGQHLRIPDAKETHACKDYYRVRKGDTLTRIARWHGINVNALADANGLSNASLIYVGQRICIPNQYASGGGYHGGYDGGYDGGHDGGYDGGHDGGYDGGHDGGYDGGHDDGHKGGGCYYTVKKGDNLSLIASWNHVSMEYLARVNHLHNPRVIIPGQRLYVCK